jgi:hypothetical protein
VGSTRRADKEGAWAMRKCWVATSALSSRGLVGCGTEVVLPRTGIESSAVHSRAFTDPGVCHPCPRTRCPRGTGTQRPTWHPCIRTGPPWAWAMRRCWVATSALSSRGLVPMASTRCRRGAGPHSGQPGTHVSGPDRCDVGPNQAEVSWAVGLNVYCRGGLSDGPPTIRGASV